MLNLQKYLDSLVVNFEGEDGIFIPFRHNPSIFVGQRGIYANIAIKPIEMDNFGNTHVVCATVKKSLLDTMSDEEKKLKTPILGNMKLYCNNDGRVTSSSQRPQAIRSEKKVNDTSVIDQYDDNDLPL